jgi:hypothetical protein
MKHPPLRCGDDLPLGSRRSLATRAFQQRRKADEPTRGERGVWKPMLSHLSEKAEMPTSEAG